MSGVTRHDGLTFEGAQIGEVLLKSGMYQEVRPTSRRIDRAKALLA